MKATLQEFIRAIRAVRTDMGDAEAETLNRALRHTVFGAMLDRSATPSDLRNELRSIVEMRLLAHPRVGGRQAAASFWTGASVNSAIGRCYLAGYAGSATNRKTMADEREGVTLSHAAGCLVPGRSLTRAVIGAAEAL
jgi:hypothetical protein